MTSYHHLEPADKDPFVSTAPGDDEDEDNKEQRYILKVLCNIQDHVPSSTWIALPEKPTQTLPI